jgi:hypothetical protein
MSIDIDAIMLELAVARRVRLSLRNAFRRNGPSSIEDIVTEVLAKCDLSGTTRPIVTKDVQAEAERMASRTRYRGPVKPGDAT